MFRAFAPLLALLWAVPVAAKPIAFGDGYTVMAEYGAGVMQEAQGFYAPLYWYSVGAGTLRMEPENRAFIWDISYVRGNLLAKRWNLPSAQANVFLWGGIGEASGTDFDGSRTTPNAGFQADYETLRFYSSVKSEWHYSSAFATRTDTAQIGWAPYSHDWDRLATWLLLQVRDYTGGMDRGLETALMLRFFQGPVWIEAGATLDGDVQAMAMFNF